MQKLFEGNKEYVRQHGATLHRHVAGQKPSLVVVTCADSRVVAHKIFSIQGIGELFGIRVAGNVCTDPSVVGSVEYAVAHLQPEKLIVLGHTKCGAVHARISGEQFYGELNNLVRQINPNRATLDEREKLTPGADEWDLYVYANVDDQVQRLLRNAVVKGAVEKGLQVLGMVYDLETGKVSLTNENGKAVAAVSW